MKGLSKGRYEETFAGEDGNRSTYVVCVRGWRDGTKFSQASPVSQSCVLEKDTFILRPRKTMWYVRPAKSQISLRIRAV